MSEQKKNKSLCSSRSVLAVQFQSPSQTIISHSDFISLFDAFRSIYMHKMQYEPLDKTNNEIRVLEFLNLSSPASTDDTIQCPIKNVSLPNFLDSQLHQEDSQGRQFPIAWDMFTESVDRRDFKLEDGTHNAAPHAGLHRISSQCSGSRYEWGDFEALSYTWGSTAETKIIYVNGFRKDVPRNLEEALRALRNLEETLFGMCYWIDSLCIDQENIEERNEQVKRMKEIYTRARAVVVWLGREEEMDRIAVQRMHGPFVGDRAMPVQSEWPALIAFAQKPYWSRCWIMQELAMNHNSTLFLCGEFKLTRRIIFNGVPWNLIRYRPPEDSDDRSDHKFHLGTHYMVRHMLNLIGLTSEPDIELWRTSVLDLVRRADATDERDKIYSILGLLDPAISAGVTPDYSLSVQQVYTDFIKSVINTSKRLDHIVFRDISAEQGWPSWVPDWRKPYQRHHLKGYPYHLASRDIPARFRFIKEQKDRTYLACSGFQVDTVDGIAAEPTLNSHATEPGTFFDGYRSQTLEAIENTFSMGNPVMSGDRLWDIPWNWSCETDDSLAGIHSNPRLLKVLQSRYFERWDKFRRHNEDFCIGGQKLRTFFPQSDGHGVDIARALENVRYTVQLLDNRALITTRTGYVGLAPVETCPGDVVAILLGCCWPVVLRPCDDGHYQLIGECYIHGLMDGEIFDRQQDEHLSEQEFIFC